MTVSQLYALYCSGHAQARTISAGALDASGLCVDARRISPLERVVLDLALLDVTNGTPMRSRESFDRAVEQGADLLAALGLDLRAERTEGLPATDPALVLDEAA